MRVSSTEFQQRVGYYLSLVEDGQKVEVVKMKPGRSVFLLTLSMESKGKKKEPSKNEEWLKMIKTRKIRFTNRDGVKFQRRVRQ